jgi:C4-dicarboxylate-specific signal transduction histidine kinase
VYLRAWRAWSIVKGAAPAAAGAALAVALVRERRRRMRAETEARGHLEALSHLDRHAVLGELTASLAHELGQPLAAILRNAEAARLLLAASPARDPQIEDIVEDIHKSDRRAVEIIRRMRDLLKRREIEQQAVDLNRVAHESVALVRPAAARGGVRLAIEPWPSELMVTGDRVFLEQVLLNLLLNSVEALSSVQPADRRVVVRSVRDNGYAVVSVSDSGPGIPHGALGRVFEPFFTTKSEGMGIGLSVSRSIVEAHDGRIAADNNPEGGATVRVWLPCRAHEAMSHV